MTKRITRDPLKYGNRYPWKEWFAQRKFTLIRGEHYHCYTHGMAQMLRNRAASKKYRLRLQLRIEEDRIHVQVL